LKIQGGILHSNTLNFYIIIYTGYGTESHPISLEGDLRKYGVALAMSHRLRPKWFIHLQRLNIYGREISNPPTLCMAYMALFTFC